MSPWPWLGDPQASAARRQALRALLGPLPVVDGTASAAPVGELLEVRSLAHARLECWRLALNSEEPVPA